MLTMGISSGPTGLQVGHDGEAVHGSLLPRADAAADIVDVEAERVADPLEGEHP